MDRSDLGYDASSTTPSHPLRGRRPVDDDAVDALGPPVVQPVTEPSMYDAGASVRVTPPLERREIAFVATFGGAAAELRRLWPGQPSARSPWRPSDDGTRLELDVEHALAAPHDVAPWLRFLSREFLAPSTASAFEAALDVGLRGGHRISGQVDVGGRRITVVLNRVHEEVLVPGAGAVVNLDGRRPQPTER